MSEPNILYSKEGFIFTKNGEKNYSLSFYLENKNIHLSKIIDFNLVKLIYDLNTDIYEKANLRIINENEAVIHFLMKHLFEELGLPQRFSYVHMEKIVKENNIQFISQSIKGERPPDVPDNAELMPVQKMICDCDIINTHTIKFTCNIVFEPTMILPAPVEKLAGLILYKIFNRVKQFIDKIVI